MNLEFTASLVLSLTLLSTYGKAQSDCTRELWIECEEECGQTCDYPFRRPTKGCLRRCFPCACFPGFVRDKDTLNCVSVFSCPPCPYNEKHKECENKCSPTCQTPLPPSDAPCTTPCTNCTCKEGFIRDEYSGRCVAFGKCPKCPPYEEFVGCARHCQTTCNNTITDSKANCRLDCATCVCKEGYIRETAGGKCIPTSGCIKCPRHEIFVNCYSPCERTCQNPSPDPSIPCVTGCTNCTCPFAHLRDEITKKCVLFFLCPVSK